MIPSYKEMMFPILEFIYKNGNTSRKDIFNFVVKHFELNEYEQNQRTSNGTILYSNRADWALSYIANNKQILELPENKKVLKKIDRGIYTITKFGKEILNSKDASLKFNNWYEKIYNNKTEIGCKNIVSEHQEKTPNDIITEASNELFQNLKSQILDEISQKDPNFFEYLVSKLLEKMGYGVGRLTKSGADGGIDGIIDEDELGLSQIYRLNGT